MICLSCIITQFPPPAIRTPEKECINVVAAIVTSYFDGTGFKNSSRSVQPSTWGFSGFSLVDVEMCYDQFIAHPF
jgi:hypothetical protein